MQLANEKTTLIKEGQIDALTQLLMQERKQIQMISQLEEEREQSIKDVFAELAMQTEEQTVSVLLNVLNDEQEKQDLTQAVTALMDNIIDLKQVEQLNAELIQQSMEFVQMSLDMLQPTVENVNYADIRSVKPKRNIPIFDSRA